jgi:hypothetical protein
MFFLSIFYSMLKENWGDHGHGDLVTGGLKNMKIFSYLSGRG